jgi:hypothetical protein
LFSSIWKTTGFFLDKFNNKKSPLERFVVAGPESFEWLFKLKQLPRIVLKNSKIRGVYTL